MKKLCLLTIIFILNGCGDSPFPVAEYSADHYRGQWVVINYWAEWCKPCIEEVPELNALDKNYENVSVLGVNFDGATGESLALQIENLNIQFATLIKDPHTDLNVPKPAVLPTTLIIDPQGNLRHTLIGPQTLASLTTATNQASNTSAK